MFATGLAVLDGRTVAVESVVIRNGVIYDGSGADPVEGSVLVRGDRVVAVGSDLQVDDARQVDAGGLVVAPGIIDMHTHSDVSLLSDPGCVSAIGQGVTTQVVGHCGFSAAPMSEGTRRSLIEEEPIFGFPTPPNMIGGWGWNSIADYLEVVRSARPSTNVATLVGHNTIRRTIVGSDDRPVGPEETQHIEHAVSAAIDEGAVGVSTGLSYAPGLFASRSELAAFATAARARGRGYHTHMRYGESTTRESLSESIETARSSGASVNVSHLYPSVDEPPSEVHHLLSMIDDARSRGVDVTFDLTLFRRGGGAWVQRLPAWSREGGSAATVAHIRRPKSRALLLEAIRGRDDWDDQLIVKANRAGGPAIVGRTIGEIARDRGQDPAETALSLVEEDAQFWVAPVIKRQDDLDELLKHPTCVPVTDGMASHPVDHAPLGLMPKTFGTFPLLFGDYVRERDVISLADAIARVTSVPADRIGLTGRGRIAVGGYADLVVFDSETIDNTATDARPGDPPTGISHVMVNGVWAIRDGRATQSRAGRVLT